MKLILAICAATVLGVGVYFSMRGVQSPSRALQDTNRKREETLTYAMTAVLALDQHGAPVPSSRPENEAATALRSVMGEDFPGHEAYNWLLDRIKTLKSMTLATNPQPLPRELKTNTALAIPLAVRALESESLAKAWWERAALLELLLVLQTEKDKLRELAEQELIRSAAGDTPFEPALVVQRVFFANARDAGDATNVTLAAIANCPNRVIRHLWASQLIEHYPEVAPEVRQRFK